MIPRVLELVVRIHGHPGIALTTSRVDGGFCLDMLRREVLEYVLSYGCRKLSNSHKVWMLAARVLTPWEILEVDILPDPHQMSLAEKTIFASNQPWTLPVSFFFGYTLKTKGSLGVCDALMQNQADMGR